MYSLLIFLLQEFMYCGLGTDTPLAIRHAKCTECERAHTTIRHLKRL